MKWKYLESTMKVVGGKSPQVVSGSGAVVGTTPNLVLQIICVNVMCVGGSFSSQ